MDEKEIEELTKAVFSNCEIYPKASPEEIKKEIETINMLLSSSGTEKPEKKKLINRIAKSFDMKQRVNQEGSWIKYVKN